MGSTDFDQVINSPTHPTFRFESSKCTPRTPQGRHCGGSEKSCRIQSNNGGLHFGGQTAWSAALEPAASELVAMVADSTSFKVVKPKGNLARVGTTEENKSRAPSEDLLLFLFSQNRNRTTHPHTIRVSFFILRRVLVCTFLRRPCHLHVEESLGAITIT
jgi:hypothetical protein